MPNVTCIHKTIARHYDHNCLLKCAQVTSPGTWLAKRDDLRLTVLLFGQIRSTRYVSAIFPLLFDEKFTFDKVHLLSFYLLYYQLS